MSVYDFGQRLGLPCDFFGGNQVFRRSGTALNKGIGGRVDKGYGLECNNMDGCNVDHHQLSKQLQSMN